MLTIFKLSAVHFTTCSRFHVFDTVRPILKTCNHHKPFSIENTLTSAKYFNDYLYKMSIHWSNCDYTNKDIQDDFNLITWYGVKTGQVPKCKVHKIQFHPAGNSANWDTQFLLNPSAILKSVLYLWITLILESYIISHWVKIEGAFIIFKHIQQKFFFLRVY